MTYPKGAIKSEKKLLGLGACRLWLASRKHSGGVPSKLHFTGRTGVEYSGNDYRYEYFKCTADTGQAYDRSLLDAHVLPQSYNDWFLFQHEADALQYLEPTR